MKSIMLAVCLTWALLMGCSETSVYTPMDGDDEMETTEATEGSEMEEPEQEEEEPEIDTLPEDEPEIDALPEGEDPEDDASIEGEDPEDDALPEEEDPEDDSEIEGNIENAEANPEGEIELARGQCIEHTDCPKFHNVFDPDITSEECVEAEFCDKNLLPNPTTGQLDTIGRCVKSACWAIRSGEHAYSCNIRAEGCARGCYPEVSPYRLDSVAPWRTPCLRPALPGTDPDPGCCYPLESAPDNVACEAVPGFCYVR